MEHYAEVAIENKKVTMLYYPEEQEKKDKLFADFSKFFGPKGPLNLNGHPTFKPTKEFFYALHTKFDTFLKSQGDAATPPPNYGNLNISRDHLEKFIKLMKDEDDVGWFIDYAAQAFSNAITIYLNNHSSELSTDERNTFESAKAMLVGQTDGKKGRSLIEDANFIMELKLKHLHLSPNQKIKNSNQEITKDTEKLLTTDSGFFQN